MEPEFIMTAREALSLILNRFKYPVTNHKCGGSVTAEDGVLLTENAVHTHPPNQVQVQVDRVV